MTVTIDIDYDDAILFCDWLRANAYRADGRIAELAGDIVSDIGSQIDNESERRAERLQETVFDRAESADINYREQMKDAGRGHLLR